MMHPLGPARERFDAVLFDLDGTLLDARSRVTVRTYSAVRALIAAGFEVLLCTGRSVAGSLSVYRGLELETPLAAYNGTWIGHPGRPPWRERVLDEDIVDAIEPAERAATFFFRHEGHRKYSIPGRHRHYERIAHWYENVVRVEGVGAMPRRGLMRISCFFPGEAETHHAWNGLAEATRASLTLQEYPLRLFPLFADSDLHLGEIQPAARGKAEVFDWLQAERGIPPARTIAVGDQRNDLTMLEAAGLAVVVENAVEEAARLADLVIGRHDEDGIAAWVEAGMPRDGRAGGRVRDGGTA